eukprot:Gb_11292 [translate_table: standard]
MGLFFGILHASIIFNPVLKTSLRAMLDPVLSAPPPSRVVTL